MGRGKQPWEYIDKYCLYCGRTACFKFIDMRIDETSYWCEYHDDTFILITAFQQIFDKGAKSHREAIKRVYQK